MLCSTTVRSNSGWTRLRQTASLLHGSSGGITGWRLGETLPIRQQIIDWLNAKGIAALRAFRVKRGDDVRLYGGYYLTFLRQGFTATPRLEAYLQYWTTACASTM